MDAIERSAAKVARGAKPEGMLSARQVIDRLMTWYGKAGELPSIKTLTRDSRLSRGTVWAERQRWINRHPEAAEFEKV